MSYLNRHGGGQTGLAAATMDRATKAALPVRKVVRTPIKTLVETPSETKKRLLLTAGPGKFVVSKDSRITQASGVSFPNLPPMLKQIMPAAVTRAGQTGFNRSIMTDVITFREKVKAAQLVPPAKDRIILGPTETAATLTNQAQNQSPLTLSIVPPPPATSAAVMENGLVAIKNDQTGVLTDNKVIAPAVVVDTAQTDAPPPMPTDAVASEAGMGWPMIAVLVGLGLVLLKGR